MDQRKLSKLILSIDNVNVIISLKNVNVINYALRLFGLYRLKENIKMHDATINMTNDD